MEEDAANRRTASRLITVLGALLLALTVVFALLPGDPAACGSILAPLFPPAMGVACAAAQSTFLPEIAACAAVGLGLLLAGMVLVPRTSARRRR